MKELLSFSPSVAAALAERRPVVALESTLLAHGMPRARRLEVAAAMNREVEARGAVPAVMAVMDGRLCVGLSDAQLERLCLSEGVTKCAERDLSMALARGGVHATTVSSTMFIAAAAGVPVFATGGIGGVHRGAVETFDESQDLTALQKHPVAVISAGAKAILDLPRTLERLETLAVLVVGLRCAEFPAFYTRESGIPLEHRVEDITQLARALRLRFGPLRQGGALICNPVPAEHALPRAQVDAWVAQALADAEKQGIQGKALTPFLLGAMERITAGRSVETNLALALNNARVGAELAVAMAGLRVF